MEDVKIPDKLGEFNSFVINNNTSKIILEEIKVDNILTYGLSEILNSQIPNKTLKIEINSKINKELEIDFKFDKNNINLVENIEIIANEGSKATIILKYNSL